MADNLLPSPAELRQLLRYEPETGKLFWRSRPGATAGERIFNSRCAGKEALTAEQRGYRVGLINRRVVSAHRVAWAIYHGEWPAGEIDHINRRRSDNRIINLRVVGRKANARNMGLFASNTSGVTGVTWSKAANKWQAQIRVDQRLIYLGQYANFDDAVRARRQAEVLHGFDKTHGL